MGSFKLSTPHRMLCKLQSKHCTVAVILLDCRLAGQPAWQTSRLQTILCRGAFCKSDSMAALAYTSGECTHWCTTKIAEGICKHFHATLCTHFFSHLIVSLPLLWSATNRNKLLITPSLRPCMADNHVQDSTLMCALHAAARPLSMQTASTKLCFIM